MIIKKIVAKKIYNSRREDTIKVYVKSDKGTSEASVPAGASVGKHEVVAFPEGVDSAVEFINKKLSNELKGFEFNGFDDLKKIEKHWNIEKQGGNALLALELALLKNLGPLWKVLNPVAKQVPRPVGVCIGGGKHFKKDNGLDIQEFLLLSLTTKNFSDAVSANERAYSLTRKQLRKLDTKFNYEIDYEGGWAPDITNFQALDLMKKITGKVSNEFGFKLRFGVDVAASSFFDGKDYVYKNSKKKVSSKEHFDFICEIIEKYNLLYIEDPFHEEDFKSFAKLNKKYGKKCMIVGDDLTTTNLIRTKKAIKEKAINAIILKPNQIGSLIEFDKVARLAKEKKLYCIVSHRAGDTMDTSISHLAVAYGAPLLKCGIYGKEREAKLQEVKKIEKQMKNS
ncbi:MAG: hypothetical protein KKH88_05035 [Nanoarchaeota archaeon]|nr:hypothetical protein [Nanoarchaeota archaeon]MBU1444792.1 hypothetical protein [Nanoarchaeota archaeon]MBU2420276.1 hypothetical protein [Nanoarchaeota archaeon]MBU2475041.1 hypothetical protein [Nanoarchaeota archaeon]MBU3941264.1 hypothetical protein [Nanoarchaeota archaeon]